MTKLEETLTIIATKAKDLRVAGITGRVSVGDVHFDLDAAEQAAPILLPPTSEQKQETNPLDDAETYGGEMPRRRGADQATETEDDD